MSGAIFGLVEDGAWEENLVAFWNPYGRFEYKLEIALFYELECQVGT